jgi:MerR family transcriptional regulator/heat shock protein HspR
MIMRSHNHAVYVISVAAELAGMHPQTLRIYERRGLVQPARTSGGNRRYSDVDIECLRRISELASEGMNLEGIRRVMQLELENERLSAENAELRRMVATAVAEADKRSPRRDLVPLNQEVSVFGGSRLGRST